MVPQLKSLTYTERLQALNLYTLEQRRLRGDLIETFKLLKGLGKADCKKFFNTARNTSTRGHSLKLYKPTHTKTLVAEGTSFHSESSNDWNSLPHKVVNAKTVSTFKKELDAY